ncbi:MAG TPA: sigma-54-dependent Fis family transcriptional regulator [Candidatus Eisenbacteria bacterium]
MTPNPDHQGRTLIEALRRVLCQLAEPVAVLRAVLDQAVSLTGADRGLFVEVEELGGLSYRVLHGLEPGYVEGERGRFSRHLFQRVLDTRERVLLRDALDDPFFGAVASVQEMEIRAILCAPIEAGGRIAALVHLESRSPGHFGPEHAALLGTLQELAGPILEALRAGREMIRERDQLRLSETRFRGEALEHRQQLASDWSFGRFLGRSAAVRELKDVVRKAAATDFPVLIAGETGTGKSILARVLHYASARSAGPLVTAFCPSFETGMVQAELFGHKRGAFTGAVADRLGKVQAADKGTLFLDEIGDLPLEIQPKLLRLLQEKTFERVGDAEERSADVRVIAATNRDLDVEVQQGRFRRDLFERLHFIPIRVPPLRERVEDIPLLLRHCLDLTDSGRWIEVAEEANRFLERLDFSWPGNVRHIEQLAARLTMEAPGRPVTAADVARLLDARSADDGGARAGLEAGLPRLLEDAERKWLAEALRRYPDVTRSEIAARLKISESALYKKLRQYGIGD